jgi:hypothetical protein
MPGVTEAAAPATDYTDDAGCDRRPIAGAAMPAPGILLGDMYSLRTKTTERSVSLTRSRSELGSKQRYPCNQWPGEAGSATPASLPSRLAP